MKLILLLVLITSCAHRQMNEKRATKLCRKIYGPRDSIDKTHKNAMKDVSKFTNVIINSCYKDHVARTKDPRDYVACAMASYSPGTKPRLTILSTQEMLPPEIVIQCAIGKFRKYKNHPKVTKPQRVEIINHLLSVTKD
jgi:hypothetical protein